MAIITKETVCSLCGKKLNDKEVISVPHFIEDKNNPLYIYSDSVFHIDCFKTWKRKDEFIELFNRWKQDKPNFRSYELDKINYDTNECDIDKLVKLANKWENENPIKVKDNILTEEEIRNLLCK